VKYEVFKPCVLPTALCLSPHSYFSRVPRAVPAWNPKTYREIVRAICSGQVVEGDRLQSLQSLICETLGVRSTILCGSGSLALELALRACGVHHGDEVVIPTFCCSAVVPPILALGATPVLADVGDELNVTAQTVAAVLTKKTRVVIVPHLFGNPAEIQEIVELAHSRNLYVIDDAAQAFGASIDGQPVGSFGLDLESLESLVDACHKTPQQPSRSGSDTFTLRTRVDGEHLCCGGAHTSREVVRTHRRPARARALVSRTPGAKNCPRADSS
jgi:hypothetical protein